MGQNEPAFVPSPEEIRRLAAKIRATWSAKERKRRAVVCHRKGWRLPIVEASKADKLGRPSAD